MIVYRSAGDKLAVDSLVCIGKLGNACLWTESCSPQRDLIVSGKSFPIKDL